MREKWTKLKEGLRGNQGFTLIELLTSLMIFAFFAVALLQYMITASSIHSTVNSNVNLEIKALATLGTIEEYAIDASASVIFEETSAYKTLYIINNEGYDSTASGCTVYAFRYDIDKGELQYLTTSSTVHKTSTVVNKTYHSREDADGNKSAYLKVETSTYNSALSAATAYNTTTVVQEFATLDAAMSGSGGTTLSTGVPTLETGVVEIKSYESDSSVEFTSFTLDESTKEVLTEEMSDFGATFVTEDGKILQVDLTFGMENSNNTYGKVATIMLRNTPPMGTIG